MKDSCPKISLFVLFGGAVLLFITQSIPYLESYSFDEEECIIKNVSYPLSIEDTSNLIKCDCGRRCMSDAGTCIKIKGNLIENRESSHRLFISSTTINSDNNGCTFAEVKCRDGEKIENRIESVRQAKLKANIYIEKMKNKNSITCYQRKGDPHLYLEKKDNSIIFFISCGLLALTTSCMCCLCCCSRCEEEDRNQSAFI